MDRWDLVEDKELFGLTFKMYRDPFVANTTFTSLFKNIDLDHQAYKYYESELYAYRILDVNFVNYIEERGDLHRLGKIQIASDEDAANTTL